MNIPRFIVQGNKDIHLKFNMLSNESYFEIFEDFYKIVDKRS